MASKTPLRSRCCVCDSTLRASRKSTSDPDMRPDLSNPHVKVVSLCPNHTWVAEPHVQGHNESLIHDPRPFFSHLMQCSGRERIFPAIPKLCLNNLFQGL